MGVQWFLQELVEDKIWWMKWEGKRVELLDSLCFIFLLVFSLDRIFLVFIYVNYNIYIMEVKIGKCVYFLIGYCCILWCVIFYFIILGFIVFGCLDGEVRIWDLYGGSESWFIDSNNVIVFLVFYFMVQFLLIVIVNEIYFWDWS